MTDRYWIRIRKVESDGETMYEARHDMFPDAVVFEDTADQAYESMSNLLPDMLEHYLEVFGKIRGRG